MGKVGFHEGREHGLGWWLGIARQDDSGTYGFKVLAEGAQNGISGLFGPDLRFGLRSGLQRIWRFVCMMHACI